MGKASSQDLRERVLNFLEMNDDKKIDYNALKKHVDLHPDHFLFEIAEVFSVTPQAIFYALKKSKITRKKRQPFTKKKVKKSERTFLRS